MNADIATLLAEAAVKQRFEELGIIVQASTPEELAAKNSAEVARWAPIIKAAGIRGE
jgi:tripartite-type tricarboxylate transporter receptor subunit TctC